MRLTLFSDGSCHGRFESLDIHLSSTGALAILQHTQLNQPDTQLTKLTIALSPFPELCKLLDFRNSFTIPYMCSSLLSEMQMSQVLTLPSLLVVCRWPLSPFGATIESIDKNARVTVDNSSQSFTVCFPVLLHDIEIDGKFNYIWAEQKLSLKNVPAVWTVPVSIIQGSFEKLTNLSYVSAELPNYDPGMYFAVTLETWLPTHEFNSSFHLLINEEMRLISHVWTDLALFSTLDDPTRIEAKIHHDGALFLTDSEFKFIEYLAEESQMYSISLPLPFAINPLNGRTYSLPELCNEFTFLYQRQHSILALQSRQLLDDSSFENQLDINPKSVEIPNVGNFQILRNGKIKVLFTDRTNVEIDSSFTIATVVDPNGGLTNVRLERVVAFKWYISKAISFRKWAHGEQFAFDEKILEVTRRNANFLATMDLYGEN
jgi:hypothetical protein